MVKVFDDSTLPPAGNSAASKPIYKQPVSVLVVIYTPAGEVLMLERADAPGFWQSVTGSRDGEESLIETVAREVQEETGIDVAAHELSDWGYQNRYEIYARWRHRYAPGVTHNTEHVFGLRVRSRVAVRLSEREHTQAAWLPWREAADKAFSPSNAAAIRRLEALLGSN